MIAHRPDWTISRQRVWGVPIVAFYCEACGTILLEQALVEHVAARMEAGEGADEWYLRSAAELLPAGTACGKCGGRAFRKETDILDVWFDSGCSHAAVLEQHPQLRWPADMYLEGSDQHRGWFHSSLLGGRGHPRAPAVPRGPDPRVRGGRRRAQDVEVRRQHRGARRRHREARRGDPAAVGGGRGLHRRTSGSRTRSSASWRRPTGGSATPAGSSSGTSPTSTRRRTRSRTRALDGPRRLGDAPAPPDDRAGAEGVRGRTSSTSRSRASTTSARWTSRRSTSTS